MRVEPRRLAQAIARIYGATFPRRLSALLAYPCHRCRGQPRMTVCGGCDGLGRVLVIA